MKSCIRSIIVASAVLFASISVLASTHYFQGFEEDASIGLASLV